jgi:hypothetical protein
MLHSVLVPVLILVPPLRRKELQEEDGFVEKSLRGEESSVERIAEERRSP